VIVGDPGRETRKAFLDQLDLNAGIKGRFQSIPDSIAGNLVLLHTEANISPHLCPSHLEAVGGYWFDE
jgi:hypothetical protein